MNRLSGFLRLHVAALRGLLVFTVITGIIYPLAMLGVAQGLFNHKANGSLVSYHGRVAGSALLCQEFVDARGNPLPQYFQPRPSAATSGASNDYGCNPLYSAASNLGPTNPRLVALIRQRQKQISAFDHVPVSRIPADAVTASGSGLDPDISPAYAAIQVDRVAEARHIRPAQVEVLARRYTTGRPLGILGEPVVNVLLLNIALDEQYPA